LSEEVDVVDAVDRVTGSAPIESCLTNGLLHRAVAVVVERSNGRVILQQRSKADLWLPGQWTLSCTGHVRKGEAYEAAASRELREELGLVSPLSAVGKFLLPPFSDGRFTEHEWWALFTARTDSEVAIDPVELESVREVAVSDLGAMKLGGPLTEDAKILLREYLSFVAGRQP
jgi:isopentenyl-diphosphate Delta-isomerase